MSGRLVLSPHRCRSQLDRQERLECHALQFSQCYGRRPASDPFPSSFTIFLFISQYSGSNSSCRFDHSTWKRHFLILPASSSLFTSCMHDRSSCICREHHLHYENSTPQHHNQEVLCSLNKYPWGSSKDGSLVCTFAFRMLIICARLCLLLKTVQNLSEESIHICSNKSIYICLTFV